MIWRSIRRIMLPCVPLDREKAARYPQISSRSGLPFGRFELNRHAVIVICAVAALATPGILAKPKKVEPVGEADAASTIRKPGYVVIELENGGRDKLRIAEGEARAVLPSIMSNDVDFITVVGANTVATVYDAPNFRGHSLTLRCGNYELLQQPRNDIESIRVSYVKTPVNECQGQPGQPVQYKTWDR
jgi:hypothetical protein